jgi:hypothetical protein
MENNEEEEKQSNEGDKSSTTPVIDAANKAAERLEQANAEQKEILERQEMLMAKNALGGQSEAGKSEEKTEETPAEYAKKVMSGAIGND